MSDLAPPAKEQDPAPQIGPWRLVLHEGASANFTSNGDGAAGPLRIAPSALGDGEPWRIQLARADVSLERGRAYILLLRARAARARAVTAAVAASEPPFAGLGLFESLPLTENWQSFRREFTAAEDAAAARLYFDVGGDDASVEIQDVLLAPREWSLVVQPGSAASLDDEVAGGNWCGRVVVREGDDRPAWHVQIVRTRVAVTGGETYSVSFRARANPPRTIACSVAQTESPYASLGLFQEFPVGEGWRDYYLEFRANRGDDSARFYFDVGGKPSTVEIANPELKRLEWKLAAAKGTSAHIVLFPRIPGETRVAVPRTAQSAPEDVRLWRPTVSMQKGRRHEVRLRARSDKPRTIRLRVLDRPSEGRSLGLDQDCPLAPHWKEYRFSFTATADADDACLALDLGAAAIPAEFADVALSLAT